MNYVPFESPGKNKLKAQAYARFDENNPGYNALPYEDRIAYHRAQHTYVNKILHTGLPEESLLQKGIKSISKLL